MRNKKVKRLRRLARKLATAAAGYYIVWNKSIRLVPRCVRWWERKLRREAI